MRLSELTPALISRMNIEDQRRYAQAIGLVTHQDDLTAHKEQPKGADSLERIQQREFASWLSLGDYPYCWHATHKKSTGSLGCPDFVVGVAGVTLWVEFKRPGFTLSKDQERFRAKLEQQGIFLHIVYTGLQAIDLVKAYEVII
jgi:hypothetical protein